MTNNDRAQIRTIMSENRGLIADNLAAMLHANATDMVAAKIPWPHVADALLTVAMTHQLCVIGHAGVIDLFRDIADELEREQMNAQARGRPS